VETPLPPVFGKESKYGHALYKRSFPKERLLFAQKTLINNKLEGGVTAYTR
jgi:hypothetical protein